MEIRLERDAEVFSRQLSMPSGLYRRIRHQLKRQSERCVFIPVRSLQYLAVIDEQEVVFVDGMIRTRIQIAWRRFHPQSCQNVGDPIPYRECHYAPDLKELALRLPGEFSSALALYESRNTIPGADAARIIPLIVPRHDD